MVFRCGWEPEQFQGPITLRVERSYSIAVSPVKISVIDDDASVRKALKRLIRSAGMSSQAFASAEDFMASQLPLPDCLVLDLRMPGMSGLELQQHLIAEHCSIPIVFISAHDDDQTRHGALSAGAAAFLHKPFDDHALLDAIAQATADNVTPASETKVDEPRRVSNH